MLQRTLLLLATTVLLSACQSVVGTGRSQLNILSHAQEMTLGQEAFDAATVNAVLVRDGEDAAMVRRVGARILA